MAFAFPEVQGVPSLEWILFLANDQKQAKVFLPWVSEPGTGKVSLKPGISYFMPSTEQVIIDENRDSP